MPIVTSELPPVAVDAIRQALEETGRFPRRARGRLSLSTPHRVYAVTLDQLVSGQAVAAAAPVGWRALLEEDERVVAAAELAGPELAKSSVVVNRGGFVDSTVEALRVAERHPRADAERLELRLLRANALYLLALWLQPLDGGTGLVFPLAPAPPPLRTETSYEIPAFEAEVAALARTVASAYRSAERPDELGG